VPSCPHCGETQVNTAMAVCPFCDGNLAAVSFSEAAEKLHSELMAIPEAKRSALIRSYPLPTEKDDIIAMLSMAVPLSMAHLNRDNLSPAEVILDSLGLLRDEGRSQLKNEASVWAAKADAILHNAKVLYSHDSGFIETLSGYEQRLNNDKPGAKKVKTLLVLVLPVLIVLVILVNYPSLVPFVGAALVLFLVWLGFQVITQRKGSQLSNTTPSASNVVSYTAPSPIPSIPAPQSAAFAMPMVSSKSKVVALILCLFLGLFGIHRFYVGKVGTGILMLFTAGGYGVLWIVDLILLATSNFKDKQGLRLT